MKLSELMFTTNECTLPFSLTHKSLVNYYMKVLHLQSLLCTHEPCCYHFQIISPNPILHTIPVHVLPIPGGNVTSAGWQVTLCDPIWHVTSRSGAVLVAQTAIRFLTLPYLTSFITAIWSHMA